MREVSQSRLFSARQSETRTSAARDHYSSNETLAILACIPYYIVINTMSFSPLEGLLGAVFVVGMAMLLLPDRRATSKSPTRHLGTLLKWAVTEP